LVELAGRCFMAASGCVFVFQGLANKTKEQSDSLLATLLDQQSKLDMFSSEMKV